MDYGTLIFKIIFDIWKSFLGIVEVDFVDTNKRTWIVMYNKKKTFSVNKREYAVMPSMVKNGIVRYMTNCSEPVKVESETINSNQFYIYNKSEKMFKKIEPPTEMIWSTNKTIYFVESAEYFSKMHNNVIDRLMVSAEKALLQNIFYISAGCLVVAIFIAYKINSLGV